MTPQSNIKQIPPRVPSRVIFRERLVNSIVSGLSKKLTIVSAGGGWGKSVLLSAFLSNSKIPAIWYNMDHRDSDPKELLTALAGGMKHRNENTGNRTLDLIAAMQTGFNWQTVLSTLFNELIDIPGEGVVIIIDDYQRVEDRRVLIELFNYFVTYSPPGVHLVISSRETPEMDAGRLRAYGELSELGADDLRFTTEETKQLFASLYRLNVTDRELDMIMEYTEGWIMSLRLLGESLYNRNGDIETSLSELKGTRKPVFEYFNEEFFNRQSEETREFLRDTSLLNRFTNNLYEHISGKEGESIIGELVSKDLFVVALDEEGIWYRYHHLFQEFLKNLAEREKESKQREEIHKRAAQWYEREGEWYEAVYHFIESGDYDAVVAILGRVFHWALIPSKVLSLQPWLEKIPDSEIESRTDILFLKGYIAFLFGRASESLVIFYKVKDMALERGNQQILEKTIQSLLHTYESRCEFSKVVEVGEEYLPLVNTESMAFAFSTPIYGASLILQNRVVDAFEQFGKVIKKTESDKNLNALVKSFIGSCYQYTGNFKESKQLIESSLKYFQQINALDLIAVSMMHSMNSMHEEGLFEECNKVCDHALAIFKRFGIMLLVAPVLSIKALNLYYSGNKNDMKQVLAEYDELKRVAGELGNFAEYFLKPAQSLSAFHEGDYRLFHAYAEEAVDFMTRTNAYYYIYLANCWLAPCFAILGEMERALSLLRDSAEKMNIFGNKYAEARSYLLLASIVYDTGDYINAKKHLAKCLDITADREYDFLYLRKERASALKLLPFALKEKLQIRHVSSLHAGTGRESTVKVRELLKDNNPEVRGTAVGILAEMKYREGEKEIAALLNDSDVGVREKAKGAIKILNSLPPEPLKIFSLGEFGLYVREREVPKSAWKRKITKSLFKYPIPIGHGMEPDIFWGVLAASGADGSESW